MRRLPATPLLVVLALLLGGGVVAALAAGGGGESDPAPPAATRDVPGVVSIGRPITPYASGTPATGQIEMRVKDPSNQAPRALLFHRWEKVRKGRRVRYDCFEFAPEKALRKYPTDSGGSCTPTGPDDLGEPWNIGIASGSQASTALKGSVSDDVVRLTIAGPGGTFVVPRSEHGGFVVLYANRVDGRAVLTATLKDGSSRYFRTSLPPTFRPDGVAIATDPDGLPDWYAGAGLRQAGTRAGETCLQVMQSNDPRPKNPRSAGGTALAPACGDLRRAPLFARTVELRPSKRFSTFSPGRFAPRRTILAGAVGPQVRSIAVTAPAGCRELEIAPAGRAFLAVFPPRVKPADLTLEVTLADGTLRRYPNPVALNRAVSESPPPTIRGRVTLRQRPVAGRRIVLTASLTGAPRRFEITFNGREVRMRRIPGTTARYQGVYDGNRGARRPDIAGRLYGFTVLLCGSDNCNVTLYRARLR